MTRCTWISRLWRRLVPKTAERRSVKTAGGLKPIPGFTPCDDAKREILRRAARPGIRTDRLEFKNEEDLVKLPERLSVRDLTIENCPNFHELSEDLFAENVLVKDCDGFSTIPKSISVTSLTIQGCQNLTKLPDGLIWNLVTIRDCPNLRKIPQRCRFNSLDLSHSQLEEITSRRFIENSLVLEGSLGLKTIPSMRLWSLNLRGCTGLSLLPDELEVRSLNISGCQSLKWQEFALIEVQSLDISDCPQIHFLPDWLTVTASIDVAGTSLKGLPPWIKDCEVLWRGVRIDERIAFRPELITAEEVLGEQNAERRRVLLERMGLEKFLQAVKYTVVDADTDPGGDRRLLELRFTDEDLRVLAVTCPSTGRNYFIRVPPYVNGCHEAAAWIAGFDNPKEYRPVMET